MAHLYLRLVGGNQLAVSGINSWRELLGAELRGCSSLRLLHFGDLGHAKAASIELHRHLLVLATGHGRLFLTCKRLALAGDS
ncbi:hypothetical protein WL1483_2469 [Aeromonas schubertii]|uniref:Uncharacterized protein n=1 Tax=Aeromonas schubertii TaxID=652 RepID=A0A0S2SJL2_9GAMM|nr:hypothetical protein WL1483_2469 [Aeromonas schubertii]